MRPRTIQETRGMDADSDSIFDPLLGVLIATVEGGSEFSVTLTIDGILISGLLVGRRAYLARVKDVFEQEGTAGTVAFIPLFDGLQGISDQHFTGALYMRDVTGVLPGGAHFRLPVWCGRVSAISGWYFGLVVIPEAREEATNK
jgi:hypothetical protein